jgi:hypothetical protein
LKERWPIVDVETEISLVDSTHDHWIVGFSAAIPTHPYLAYRRRRSEVVHDDCEFDATFRSSDKR